MEATSIQVEEATDVVVPLDLQYAEGLGDDVGGAAVGARRAPGCDQVLVAGTVLGLTIHASGVLTA